MERTPDASEVIGGGALRAIVHSAPEGGYWAKVPEFPGCYTQAETLDELVLNLQEAVEGWLEKDDNPITVSVPVHGNRDLKTGILAALLKDAGLTENDL